MLRNDNKNKVEKNNSSVLIANAYHHRSDVWASVVALAGLGGAYLG